MKYDFHSIINRTEDGSSKWLAMHEMNPEVGEEIMPLSVADMEFKNAPEIINGLKEKLDSVVLGYSQPTQSYLDTIVKWQKEEHQWEIEGDWIVTTPGVVAAINAAILAFSEPGEGVIYFSPVYGPFSQTTEENKRKEINIPLLEEERGYYTIDFAAFEKAAADSNNKILLFCSPHNPVGRAWAEEELEKIAEICVEHDLIVISDEIWNDIVFEPYKHTVLADMNSAISDRTLVCTSASKSFNLAAMQVSNIIIPNSDLRKTFQEKVDQLHYSGTNLLGLLATELAYSEASDWLEEMKEVVRDNQKLVVHHFEEHFPEIKAYLPEATYVQWLDFRHLNVENYDDFHHLLAEKAEFFVTPGDFFGKEGEGFMRLNVALPQDILEESLMRLTDVLQEEFRL